MVTVGLISFSCVCFFSTFSANAEKSSTYRVATVQFDPYFENGVEPSEIMTRNSLRYAEYAKEAKQRGASMVVFPEYGITSLDDDPTYANFSSRDGINLLLQNVPDPKKEKWNPCLDPLRFDDARILEILSCASRNNSIALLANILSKEECDDKSDPRCPPDGRYQRNTNVIFDAEGALVATYHKQHLYAEFILDAPAQAEYVIFEVDSIKFASFICFDVLYADPSVRLVTEKGIKNVIFSTAWGSELPLLMAPQLFASWARGLGANLIVSNYYKPRYGRLGTGIYSSQSGALTETFDISEKGKLLIADVPTEPSPVPEEATLCSESFESDNPSVSTGNNSYVPFVFTDKPSSRPVAAEHKIFYQRLSNFSAIYLEKSEGSVGLCDGRACCRLSYRLENNDDPAFYALLAYDGVRPMFRGVYNLGTRVCALMRCETKGDVETCGRVPSVNSTSVFHELSLEAQLEDDVAFPSVVKSDLRLLSDAEWDFSRSECGERKFRSKITVRRVDSLLITSIYSRLYNEDYNNFNFTNPGGE